MFDDELLAKARLVIDAARARQAMIVTAESCTGGLVAAVLTAVAGSSDVVDGGFVTYSNEAKMRLGVPEATLAQHGAVSEATARSLAEAARSRLTAQFAPKVSLGVSVTGVAGPGGGSVAKPVGLVHFALAAAAGTRHRVERFGDLGRDVVRRESVFVAFSLLHEALVAPLPGDGAVS